MINAERRFEHGEKREAWLNGEPLAQVDAGSPEVLTTLHTDHIMTARAGSNAAGSTVWTWDSGAFGKEAATGSASVNLRFPGQYYDAETGLHYNWNRTYNPATGRYVSSDPIGLAGGLNTFGYVGQSPIMYSDPDGHMTECVDPDGTPVPCKKYYPEGTGGAWCPSGACADGRAPSQFDESDITPQQSGVSLKCIGKCMLFLGCGLIDGPFAAADIACASALRQFCIHSCNKQQNAASPFAVGGNPLPISFPAEGGSLMCKIDGGFNE